MGAAYVLAGILVGTIICKTAPGQVEWVLLIAPAGALMITGIALEFQRGRR